MTTAAERREALKHVWEQARQCRACALHETRTTVVFGAGNADADLMFVGEAPGANEDKQGLPFVGAAGKLLDQLLEEIGIERSEVFIANTLKCRPPDNRNPMPLELEACEKYLFSQLELIQPIVVCTLGNFSTKLLRNDATGISKLHGRDEIRQIGPRTVRLYPLYHPAAALYTRATLDLLREDFSRIPGLLAKGAPPQPNLETAAARLDDEHSNDTGHSDERAGVPSLLLSGSKLEADEASAAEISDTPDADSTAGPEPAAAASEDDSGEQLGLF
jgi:uracil-DNA glycosylase